MTTMLAKDTASDLFDAAAESQRERLRSLGWLSHFGDTWTRPGESLAVTEDVAFAWLSWRDGVIGAGDSDEGEAE